MADIYNYKSQNAGGGDINFSKLNTIFMQQMMIPKPFE